MMSVTSALMGLSICATDGKIGTVSDLLFDDTNWRLRWLVVDTGHWLPGRLVLLHPSALGQPDFNRKILPVGLTRARVEASPDIQQDLPVSRQMEQGVFAYYGWDPYWGGGAFGMEGLAAPLAPGFMPPIDSSLGSDVMSQQHEGDPHLRSVSATDGYSLHATDGHIGHVSDFLMDTHNWVLRYLIVDTRNWWPGKHVLLSPHCVKAIDWVEQSITIDVSCDKVRASPEWDPAALINSSYEQRLRDHYDWPPLM